MSTDYTTTKLGPRFRSEVTVRVPATSANLGPGFDCLGLALGLLDEVTFGVIPRGLHIDITGEQADVLPRNEQHLVVRAARAAWDVLGITPPGFRMSCVNRIPHSRGLGSSAAAIVAGILGARSLTIDGEKRMSDHDVLALAAKLEGHPDNVAAALYGGLAISWTDSAGAQAVRLTPSEEIRPIAFVSDQEASTAKARSALPEQVPYSNAVHNVGRTALLVHAVTSAPKLLFAATEDQLHQPFRASAMPESFDLVTGLRQKNIPAVLSGAGPTVLAFLPADIEAESLTTTGFTLIEPGLDQVGAVVEMTSSRLMSQALS